MPSYAHAFESESTDSEPVGTETRRAVNRTAARTEPVDMSFI